MTTDRRKGIKSGRTTQCKAALRTALRRSVGALRLSLTPCGAVSFVEGVTGGQKPAKSAGSLCAGEAGAARSTPCTEAAVRGTRLPRSRDHARLPASPVPADAQNMHHIAGAQCARRASHFRVGGQA